MSVLKTIVTFITKSELVMYTPRNLNFKWAVPSQW
jgi:hypothetical protein